MRELFARGLSREAVTFLAVGGTAYVIDVLAFNWLRGQVPFVGWDPSVARTLAMMLAMCVTYIGNRSLTWRGVSGGDRRREVALFVLFNVAALGISVLCLVVSHDLLGFRSQLADNISANGFGLALGTAFRFWSYRTFVFQAAALDPHAGNDSSQGWSQPATSSR